MCTPGHYSMSADNKNQTKKKNEKRYHRYVSYVICYCMAKLFRLLLFFSPFWFVWWMSFLLCSRPSVHPPFSFTYGMRCDDTVFPPRPRCQSNQQQERIRKWKKIKCVCTVGFGRMAQKIRLFIAKMPADLLMRLTLSVLPFLNAALDTHIIP